MDRGYTGVKAVLYIAAGVCGIGFLGAVGPWEWLDRWMWIQYAVDAPDDSIVQYGLRIACATYAFAGLYFLIVARQPHTHAQFVNLGATGLLFAGAVALIAGAGLDLPPQGYLVDAVVLCALGALLFALSPMRERRRRRRKKRRRSKRRRTPRTPEADSLPETSGSGDVEGWLS